jgi:imidazolonepropionase-like amidohydrolase
MNVWRSLVLLVALAAVSSGARADDVVIRDVAVVDVAAGVVHEGRDVWLDGPRIAAVEPHGTREDVAGVRTIDGRGRYLAPGLWDAHVHVFSMPREEDVALPLYLVHGITAVRDVGAFRTRPEIVAVAAAVERGERPGPHMVLAGAAISGPPGAWPGIPVAATPAEGRARVRELHAAGWRTIKVYSLLQPEVLAAIGDEARSLGMPVYGHVSEAVTVRDALAAGQRGVEHLDKVRIACSPREDAVVRRISAALRGVRTIDEALAVFRADGNGPEGPLDEARCRALAAAIPADGWVTPTLNVADFYLGRDPPAEDPRMQDVPAAVRAAWSAGDARRRGLTDADHARIAESVERSGNVLRILRDAGVTILAGSDAGYIDPYSFHGASLHTELERLVSVGGFTPREALAAATIAPARLFGDATRRAEIRAGQRADLLLLNADPLESVTALSRVDLVIAAGRVYDAEARSALRNEARRRGATVIAGRAGP